MVLTLDGEEHVGGVADPGDGDGARKLAGILGEDLGDDERAHAVAVDDLVVVGRFDLDLVAEPLDSFRGRVGGDGALQHHPLPLPHHAVAQRL